jgi:EAL domain-containing protein (putative c-di-GMP-specific phosphodiesterase class I)
MITTDDVRDGMNRGELFVEYQPIVSLITGDCLGGEALVRWRRPEGVVPPFAFIPVVENTPLSGRLTYWVIDTVAAELGEWLRKHADVHICINVPPEILGRGGIEYAAVRSGLRARAHQIVLEITERGIPDRLGLEALNALADHGVALALDDTTLTGTNAALLTRANFKILKLDRALTAELVEGGEAPDWLGALRSLLRSSTLHVIAEGVESSYQALTLRAAGVRMAQGYLFSMPLPARAFMEFYAERLIH